MSCINTMNHFNPSNLLLVCLLFLSACTNAELAWDYDGSVSQGGNRIKTKLDNTYSGLITEQGVFLAGYEIDSQGINHPFAALVQFDLGTVNYWPQTKDIKQFFQYQDNTYMLSSTGQTHLFQHKDWTEDQQLLLKANSIVIDSSPHIIACSPAPLMKTSHLRGSCYSPGNGWEIELSWSLVKPALCGEYLTVIEDRSQTLKAHQINLISGNIVRSIELKTAVADACAVVLN